MKMGNVRLGCVSTATQFGPLGKNRTTSTPTSYMLGTPCLVHGPQSGALL